MLLALDRYCPTFFESSVPSGQAFECETSWFKFDDDDAAEVQTILLLSRSHSVRVVRAPAQVILFSLSSRRRCFSKRPMSKSQTRRTERRNRLQRKTLSWSRRPCRAESSGSDGSDSSYAGFQPVRTGSFQVFGSVWSARQLSGAASLAQLPTGSLHAQAVSAEELRPQRCRVRSTPWRPQQAERRTLARPDGGGGGGVVGTLHDTEGGARALRAEFP